MAALVFRQSGRGAFRQANLYFWAAIALVPCGLWYWHAHRIAEAFYPYHFFGGGGVRLMPLVWYGRLALKLLTSTLTPVFALAAITGMWTVTKRNAEIFYAWLIAMVAFIVVVGWGNRHEWYQLPLVPIAAAFAGAACVQVVSRFASLGARLVVTFAILVSLGFCSALYACRLYESSAAPLRALGLELQETTAPGALIIAADDGDPTAFYYGRRKGWHFPEKRGLYYGNPADDWQLVDDLEQLRRRGATHLVFYIGTSWWLDYYRRFAEHLANNSRLLRSNDAYMIYELRPVP